MRWWSAPFSLYFSSPWGYRFLCFSFLVSPSACPFMSLFRLVGTTDLRRMLSVHSVAEAQTLPILAYHSDQTPSSLTILFFCSLPPSPYARKLVLTRVSLLLCRVCQKGSPPPL